MRIAMAKEAFNRKISLLTRKLNIEEWSCWKIRVKIKWPEKLTNEEVLECIGANRSTI